jgi:hypothetical protein
VTRLLQGIELIPDVSSTIDAAEVARLKSEGLGPTDIAKRLGIGARQRVQGHENPLARCFDPASLVAQADFLIVLCLNIARTAADAMTALSPFILLFHIGRSFGADSWVHTSLA